MLDLNFKSFGQGPALIILHGLFGSLDNWTSLARKYASHFSVYVIDQRNHGKSPHHPEWNYEVMAHDLNDFIEQEGIYSANILGHSMGGKVCMKFADKYPEKIEKLIVADMAPVAYSPSHNHILDSLNSIDLSAISDRQMADEELQKGIPEFSVRQFLLKGLGRDKDKSFKWKFNLDTITNNYHSILQAVSLNTPCYADSLFIYGGKSEYQVASHKSLITSYFPNARFEEISTAGHWLHAQEPTIFFDQSLAFLLS
ncbi:MAG: alpha/beta fold hydrolase [Bacteroidia bacterium]|nr:alpha/beta fold hydrolase [Bacteroidia bacterium]